MFCSLSLYYVLIHKIFRKIDLSIRTSYMLSLRSRSTGSYRRELPVTGITETCIHAPGPSGVKRCPEISMAAPKETSSPERNCYVAKGTTVVHVC